MRDNTMQEYMHTKHPKHKMKYQNGNTMARYGKRVNNNE
jgi:hypothetical protein